MYPAHIPYAHYGMMRMQTPKSKKLLMYSKIFVFSPFMEFMHLNLNINLMVHIPSSVKADREGGRPLEMSVKKLDVNGFIGKQERSSSIFIAPCIFQFSSDLEVDQGNGSETSAKNKKVLLLTICESRILTIYVINL